MPRGPPALDGAHSAHLARREAALALTHLLAAIPRRRHIPPTGLAATTTPVGIDIHRFTVEPV